MRLSVSAQARTAQSLGMQRLFSVFPPGSPGIGLLLFRLSAATACLQTCAHCESSAAWVRYAVIAISGCLYAGAFTSMVALLALAGELTAAASLHVHGGQLITVLNAAAVALLGPGAYSLDALRFGRRVILVESWRAGDLD
jgi:hypothetical protein